MSSDAPAFKVHVFPSDFEFWIGVDEDIKVWIESLHNSYQRETIYDKFDVFRKFSLAMKAKRVSKIWVRMSTTTTNIHSLQFKI